MKDTRLVASKYWLVNAIRLGLAFISLKLFLGKLACISITPITLIFALISSFFPHFLFYSVKPTMEPVKPTMDPCFDQTCTYHGECIVDHGLPKCVCPSNCPNTSAPVCGSNGVTYENDCAMRRASCNGQLTITIVSRARCRK